jgi:hypothetical protein
MAVTEGKRPRWRFQRLLDAITNCGRIGGVESGYRFYSYGDCMLIR